MLIISISYPSKQRLLFDIFIKNQVEVLKKSSINEYYRRLREKISICSMAVNSEIFKRKYQVRVELKLPLNTDAFNQVQVQNEREVKCIRSVSRFNLYFFGFMDERDDWEITKRELAFYNFARKGGETR